jgi:methionyl-tRNA formyltransferase
LGAPLVASVIDAFETGTAVPLPQDDRAATGARRLQKADGAIDWTRPAFAIKNQVRALEPWPKTYCFWNRPQGASLRLILGTVQAAGDARLGHPGEILDAGPDTIRVATGVGALVILTLQPAGKRMLTAAEFLRGYPLAPHDRLA